MKLYFVIAHAASPSVGFETSTSSGDPEDVLPALRAMIAQSGYDELQAMHVLTLAYAKLICHESIEPVIAQSGPLQAACFVGA